MTTVFADTFYFLALLDSREDRHQRAAEFSRDPQLIILTTEWVLAEFGAKMQPASTAAGATTVPATASAPAEVAASQAQHEAKHDVVHIVGRFFKRLFGGG